MDGIYVRISRIQYRLKKENVDTVRILQVENFWMYSPFFAVFLFRLSILVTLFYLFFVGGILILIQPIRHNFSSSQHLQYVTTTQFPNARYPTQNHYVSCSFLHYALPVPKLLIRYFHFSVQKYVYINGQLIALFIIFFNISHIVFHI